MFEWMQGLLTNPRFYDVVRSLIVIVIGLPLLHLGTSALGRILKKQVNDQVAMLANKGIYYLGVVLLIVLVMQNLGFKLTAILGAAGILGIAISFASQTSLSNIISGVFLIWERPFTAGDMIKVGDTLGIVLSIDLLSVKLRTTDNRYIRVPNETLIKSQVITVTRFPIRRMDIDVGVAYKENVGRVMEILTQIADANPFSLDEPRPLVLFKDFGDSSLELLLGVWFAKADFLNLKNSIMREIKERFDAEGIEIAFPHLTVYSGAASDPFPIRVVDPAKETTPAPSA